MKDPISFKLTEAKVEKDKNTQEKRLYFEGIFSVADKKNRNNRIYPKTIWEKNLKKSSPFMKNLTGKAILGELEHPESGSTSLQRVSHQFLEAKLQEDGKVWAKGRVLDTPNGRILAELFAVGYPVGASSRGSGTSEKNDNEEEVVSEDYTLETWDFVYKPSVQDVETHVLNQERLESLQEEVIPVTSIFERYGCNDGDGKCVVDGFKEEINDDTSTVNSENVDLKFMQLSYCPLCEEAFVFETEVPLKDRKCNNCDIRTISENGDVCRDCIIEDMEKVTKEEAETILQNVISKVSSGSKELVDALLKHFKKNFIEKENTMGDKKEAVKTRDLVENLVLKANSMKQRVDELEGELDKAKAEKNTESYKELEEKFEKLQERYKAAVEVAEDFRKQVEEKDESDLKKKLEALQQRYSVLMELADKMYEELEGKTEQDDEKKDKDKEKDDKEKDDEDGEDDEKKDKEKDKDKDKEKKESDDSDEEDDDKKTEDEKNNSGKSVTEDIDKMSRRFSESEGKKRKKSSFFERSVETYEEGLNR